MLEFRIPKDTHMVVILYDNGKRQEGLIFLEHFPEQWLPDKKVAAFIEEDRAFFPFLIAGTECADMVNKDNLLAVEIESALSRDGNDTLSEDYMHKEKVTVVLNNAESIQGLLCADTPADRSRLSDCLNMPGKFLTIRAGDKVIYINKKKVEKVMSGGNNP